MDGDDTQINQRQNQQAHSPIPRTTEEKLLPVAVEDPEDRENVSSDSQRNRV